MTRLLKTVLAGVLIASLGGCAAAEPQALDLTWTEPSADEAVTTSIDFGTVTCEEFNGSRTIESDETQSYPEERAVFRATTIGKVTAVSLLLEGGYIFVSSEPFTITSDGVTFDEQPGHVSRNSGSEKMIDTEARLSGTVDC